MRIGELLLQQGLISPATLDAALRTQARYGGRLASVLVELGAVDGDVATRALAKLRRAPAVLKKHFDAANRRALARIPAKIAEKHGAVALGFTGDDALIVAMRDPTDLLATEEVRFVAGMKITVGVALDARIRNALERHYGVARSENRFVAMSMDDDGTEFETTHAGNMWDTTPPSSRPPVSKPPISKPPVSAPPVVAPPLSVPPPSSSSWRAAPRVPDLTLDAPPASVPIAPTTPRVAPSVGPTISPGPTGNASRPSAVSLESSGPSSPIASGSLVPSGRPTPLSVVPPHAPPPVSVRPGPMRSIPPIPREEPPVDAPTSMRLTTASPQRSVVDANSALARAPTTSTFEGRVDAILTFLQSCFEAAIVFAIRNDVALGWKAFGPGSPVGAVPGLGIPLTQPSVLVVPYEARTPFVGAPPADDAFQSRIAEVLRTPPAREVVVVPLVVEGNVAALVYAQPRAGERVPPTAVVELTRLATRR